MQTLEQFLAAYKPGDYERPSVTADVAAFTFADGALQLLLIRRGNHPYNDCYALPGGFIEMNETLRESAARELFEETSVRNLPLCPIGLFGDPTRDPRTRIITAAFAALVPAEKLQPRAGDDAADAALFALDLCAGGEITIPARTPATLISLPCSADGRMAERGRELTLTLSGAECFTSQLALCEDPLDHYPVLLNTSLASDHALIITQALLWLCSLDIKKAAHALCPGDPSGAQQAIERLQGQLQ